MTVKELFNSFTFGEIIKALRNTHRNDRSIENVAAYKEAFDIICLTEFEGEGGEWKNRSRLGQCAGAGWDTFDDAKLMIFPETFAF